MKTQSRHRREGSSHVPSEKPYNKIGTNCAFAVAEGVLWSPAQFLKLEKETIKRKRTISLPSISIQGK